MALTIQVGMTDKKKNSTKVPPLGGGTYSCLLKERTSVIHPTFVIHDEANMGLYNYMYCPEFRRYYYILDVRSITAVVWEIDGAVDVLATYSEQIKNTEAFIMFAESEYSPSIADNRIPIKATSEFLTSQASIPGFDKNGCYIVTGIGESTNTGVMASIAMNGVDMINASRNLVDANVFEEWYDSINANPIEAIVGCTWIPLTKGEASGGTSKIKMAGKDYFTGAQAKTTYQTNFDIDIPFKYFNDKDGTFADYRNVEPYTIGNIWLPGAGLVNLPLAKLMDSGGWSKSLKVYVAVGVTTGDVTYYITANGQNNNVLVVSGNFGVQTPVGKQTSGFVSGLGALIGSFGTSMIGVATSNPLMLAGGVAGSVASGVKMMSETSQVSGKIGGWATFDSMVDKAQITLECYDISDNPSNIMNTIGRPLYKSKRIGDMSGYIQCTGTYVQCFATEEEHMMLSDYLNKGNNFQYGGIIIE